MLSNIGIPGFTLLLVFALLIFGPLKLPEMGRTLGEFQSVTRDFASNETKGGTAPLKKASGSKKRAAVTGFFIFSYTARLPSFV
ncbi:twin-arginine translocase TatA/TatE family subunit [Geobacillus subterraneus]|uniref:twin-arginine translocase TatA/TatE family subunit n=1 Tax=Geobacillus subterraneus TaxID=129338 RepID=UPI00160D302F